jgi:hypothetical protein
MYHLRCLQGARIFLPLALSPLQLGSSQICAGCLHSAWQHFQSSNNTHSSYFSLSNASSGKTSSEKRLRSSFFQAVNSPCGDRFWPSLLCAQSVPYSSSSALELFEDMETAEVLIMMIRWAQLFSVHEHLILICEDVWPSPCPARVLPLNN